MKEKREKKSLEIPVKLIIGIALFVILLVTSGFFRVLVAGATAWFVTSKVQLEPKNRVFTLNV